MEFTCQCGSNEFHYFYKYPAIRKSRFRCKNCHKTYEQSEHEVVEIDLKSMWEESKRLLNQRER